MEDNRSQKADIRRQNYLGRGRGFEGSSGLSVGGRWEADCRQRAVGTVYSGRLSSASVWWTRMRPGSTIQRRPTSGLPPSALRRVSTSDSRIGRVGFLGRLSTTTPALRSGGNRVTSPKSTSRVMRQRPSRPQISNNCRSGQPQSSWLPTVDTSCPAARKSCCVRVPKFSSSLNFTGRRPHRWARTGLWTFRRRRRWRHGCRVPQGLGNPSESPELGMHFTQVATVTGILAWSVTCVIHHLSIWNGVHACRLLQEAVE